MATPNEVFNPIAAALNDYAEGKLAYEQFKWRERLKEQDDTQRHANAMAILRAQLEGHEGIARENNRAAMARTVETERAAMDRAIEGDKGAMDRSLAVQNAEKERQLAIMGEVQQNRDVSDVEARNDRRTKLYTEAAQLGFKVDPDKSPDENEMAANGVLAKANTDSLKGLLSQRRGVMEEIDNLLTPVPIDDATLSRALATDARTSASFSSKQIALLKSGMSLDQVGKPKGNAAEFALSAQEVRKELQAQQDKESQMRASAKLRALQSKHEELGMLIGHAMKDVPTHQLGDALSIPSAPAGVTKKVAGWTPGAAAGAGGVPGIGVRTMNPAAATDQAAAVTGRPTQPGVFSLPPINEQALTAQLTDIDRELAQEGDWRLKFTPLVAGQGSVGTERQYYDGLRTKQAQLQSQLSASKRARIISPMVTLPELVPPARPAPASMDPSAVIQGPSPTLDVTPRGRLPGAIQPSEIIAGPTRGMGNVRVAEANDLATRLAARPRGDLEELGERFGLQLRSMAPTPDGWRSGYKVYTPNDVATIIAQRMATASLAMPTQ
jgi:hypothetical protein